MFYEWIAFEKVAKAASFIASLTVGWPWHIRATSSEEAPKPIATLNSCIIVPASWPIICAPRILSVSSSDKIFKTAISVFLSKPIMFAG